MIPVQTLSIIGSLSQQDGNYALMSRGSRIVGTIIPNVVIEETMHDEMTVTDHPVESGAMISDHAFARPVEIEMRCAWSNATGRSEGYVQMIYQQVLDLQKDREPFTVYTPKRVYKNMLITGVSITTDQKSEYALNAQLRLREIIITNTEMTTGTPGGAAAGSPSRPSPSANGIPYADSQLSMAQQGAASNAVSPGLLNFGFNSYGGF